MADDKMTITFKCGKCQSLLSCPDDSSDSTEIYCPHCGEMAGTYGELHAKGMEAAKMEVESIMKKAFNN